MLIAELCLAVLKFLVSAFVTLAGLSMLSYAIDGRGVLSFNGFIIIEAFPQGISNSSWIQLIYAIYILAFIVGGSFSTYLCFKEIIEILKTSRCKRFF